MTSLGKAPTVASAWQRHWRVSRAVQGASVTVDDGDPIDVLRRRFELFSPQRTVELPVGNVFEVEPQTAAFTRMHTEP